MNIINHYFGVFPLLRDIALMTTSSSVFLYAHLGYNFVVGQDKDTQLTLFFFFPSGWAHCSHILTRVSSQKWRVQEWGRGGSWREGGRKASPVLGVCESAHWVRPPHLSITSPANHFCASSSVLPTLPTPSLYLYARAETPPVVHMCCVELDSLWLARIIRPQRVVCETPRFPSHLPSVNNVTLNRRPHLQCRFSI